MEVPNHALGYEIVFGVMNFFVSYSFEFRFTNVGFKVFFMTLEISELN